MSDLWWLLGSLAQFSESCFAQAGCSERLASGFGDTVEGATFWLQHSGLHGPEPFRVGAQSILHRATAQRAAKPSLAVEPVSASSIHWREAGGVHIHSTVGGG
jgi:hypothetical protein